MSPSKMLSHRITGRPDVLIRKVLSLLAPLLVLFSFPALLPAQTPPPKPIPVKVVVLAMFERGEDTGDAPGEYQFWVERDKLDQIIPMPAGYHHVRMNKDGELGVLTGVGTAR